MSDNAPAIAVLPYGHAQKAALSKTPLSELSWPLGCPERLRGGTLADMGRDDHLIVFPKTITHIHPRRNIRARVSLLQVEPAIIHAKHIRLLHWTYRRFFRVLTFNQTLLARLPNAILFPYGTTWVPDWRKLKIVKSEMASLIASAKRDSDGHKLRHDVADWVRKEQLPVQLMGGGYAPFEEKSDGLARYRYSVVIENVREPNYFSEKLLDAIFCETVPIYWGCPNLADFFDPSGIIECGSEEDMQRAIAAMTEADYERRLPKIKALKPILDPFCDLELRAAKTLYYALAD